MSEPVIIQTITLCDDTDLRWLSYEFVMSDPTKNIVCKIDNESHCCEHWGISIDKDTTDFIGAEYLSVTVDDPERDEAEYDEGEYIRVTIHTNRGPLVMMLYNCHNGYYPHDTYIETEHGIQTHLI